MSSSKPGPGESLAEKRPDIATEWNQEKNGDLTPWDISCGSNKKVWWICSKGHEWEATIYHRAMLNRGCPYCANKKVLAGYNDLATTHPHLAAEWHPTKNDKKPSEIIAGNHTKYWWKCSQGHEWQASPNSRTNTYQGELGCPYCSNHPSIGVIQGINDLATLAPELVKEWHPKNILKPTEVRAWSREIIHWICENGHEWDASVCSRYEGNGCPHCSAQGTSYGEQYIYWALKQLYSDAINRFKTSNHIKYDIYIPSINLAIEYSGKTWHEGKEQRDQYKKNLALEHNKEYIDIIERTDITDFSFEQNHFEYNPLKDQDKQLKLIIDRIIKGYNHTVSEIDFEKVKKNATEYSKGKIEYDKSLEYLYPELVKDWHINNKLKPSEVTPGSGKIVLWKCSKCGYEWSCRIMNRTINNTGCPNCYNQRRGKKKSGLPEFEL